MTKIIGPSKKGTGQVGNSKKEQAELRIDEL
jgi:hypothetical protein